MNYNYLLRHCNSDAMKRAYIACREGGVHVRSNSELKNLYNDACKRIDELSFLDFIASMIVLHCKDCDDVEYTNADPFRIWDIFYNEYIHCETIYKSVADVFDSFYMQFVEGDFMSYKCYDKRIHIDIEG